MWIVTTEISWSVHITTKDKKIAKAKKFLCNWEIYHELRAYTDVYTHGTEKINLSCIQENHRSNLGHPCGIFVIFFISHEECSESLLQFATTASFHIYSKWNLWYHFLFDIRQHQILDYLSSSITMHERHSNGHIISKILYFWGELTT